MSHNYTLNVKDFGPIAEARVDMRPLTVFVGPSNTGKSYLATLIYALHRSLRDPGELPEPPDQAAPDSDLVTPAMLAQWAAAAAKSKAGTAPLCLPDFPEEVNEFVKSFLGMAPGLDRRVDKELRRCFGVTGVRELVRRPYAADAQIHLEIPRRANRGTFDFHVSLGREGVQASGGVTGTTAFAGDAVNSDHTRSLYRHAVLLGRNWLSHAGESDLNPALHPEPLEKVILVERVLDLLCETVQRSLLQPIGTLKAHYLPSDRAGMVHSRDVVMSSLLHRATTGGSRTALLSGVSADFLDQLIRLPAEANDEDPTTWLLARHLEEAVLGGEVRVELSEAGYPHLWYRPAGWTSDLPLMRASSMVVELAPIILYLRHIVRPGELLIIDEPESHLHPAVQVEVIRHLAEAVRSGIRVIVTTHSEWVLDELANIIQASQIGTAEREAIGKDAVVLQPHEVGAWLFDREVATGGVAVKELHVDDTGLFPSGFDEVAVALHNRWASIASRLEDNEQ